MAYKIELVAEGLVVIKPGRWWNDPMSVKDVLTALEELSSVSKLVSVCRIGGGFTPSTYLVVTEKK